MGRVGRYTLSVMVWVAAYAGWSSVLGIVVAAITGDRLDAGDDVAATVSIGVSTLFSVLVPLVPTLAALWFNDWARDGFPSRDEKRRLAARAAAGAPAGPAAPVVPGAAADPEADDPARDPAPEPAGFPVAPLLRDG